MRPRLLYRDRDFELPEILFRPAHYPRDGEGSPKLPALARSLIQDLELETVFNAMSGGDRFLLAAAQKGLLESMVEPEAIIYRQQVLEDCLRQSAIVQQLYALSVEALERRDSTWMGLTDRHPDGVLHRSVEALRILLPLLRQLRSVAEQHAAEFYSEGFKTFFQLLVRELGDDYLAILKAHTRRLSLRRGLLISAELGSGNHGIRYVMRSAQTMSHGWRARLKTWAYGVTQRLPSKYTYQIAERDESGMRALSDIQARGIGQVAATLGRSVDHLMAFFRLLRSELGFLVACLNLHARLARKDEQVCFPDALAATASKLSARDLFDISLSLITDTRAVSNRLEADGKSLVMVTGANGGGKSTFLRSLGQAQIMMQAGMFVPATSFRASLCAGLFTHFKREEDALLRSGKLDEELHRLSAIVDHLKFGCLVLLNESFASTNEREGSEIGRQFVRALLDSGVRMIFVTHLFTLAHGLYLMHREDTLFLRADRRPDGGRTFQLNEGEPLATSHGVDLYRRIFGVDTEDRADPDTPAREEEPKGEPAYVQLRERARSR